MRPLTRRDAAAKNEGGFTMMEMVVAISVLAVVVLAVSGVIGSGLRALAAAKARARANEMATQGIEDLQRLSFNNLGLCAPPPGTPPAGLETNVDLDCSGAGITFAHPCGATGLVPATTYTCTDNNVTYSVKRYVAWVDALQTTKRLAVFVEWTDLAGNHRVSQQSSLRAPDQSAITGLTPPKFTSAPSFGPVQVNVDAAGHLTSSVTLNATTSDLHKPASTLLKTAIAAHQPNDQIDISVAAGTGTLFPPYNGFSIGIDQESFRVIGGAGTDNWTVVAEENASHALNSQVQFVGDQVYAQFQTIADNGNPQTSTLFLAPSGSNPITSWTGFLTPTTPSAAQPHRFGVGKQHITFGIMRAADGKQTAAFATTAIEVCGPAGCADPTTHPSITPGAIGTVQIGSGGELLGDVTFEVATKNVTASDSVTLSFLTEAGSISVGLQTKAGTTCPDSTTTTYGFTCQWVGRIEDSGGYRFTSGLQSFYFSAQQILDTVNAGSVDRGATSAALVQVTFAS